jgi:hypothetical protein
MTRLSDLTAKQRADIVRLVEDGMPQVRVARLFDVTEAAITRVLDSPGREFQEARWRRDASTERPIGFLGMPVTALLVAVLFASGTAFGLVVAFVS